MARAPDHFFIDPLSHDTLQQQIQRLVCEAILAGRFQPGERLPSSRKLADHLGVSRITVSLAYSELVANDFVAPRGRSGYYVSHNAPAQTSFPPRDEKREAGVDWTKAIGQRYSEQVLPLKPQHWRDYRYRFIYGQSDDALFDHRNWRKCAIQALGKKDFASTSADYFERDDPELIKYIALQTLPRRGIYARPEEILITLGAQNALWLAAQVLLNQRRTAAMDDPGYHGLRAILNQTRCDLVTNTVDEMGTVFEDLPERTNVLFVTPSHHCPTNATMPVERRAALLEHARRNDYLIVEDDYEFEMSFLKPPAPAIKSLDREERVIYVGSFSKSIFPGLRLGYLVGPQPFIKEVRALRAAVLRHPPGQLQRTVASFLALGYYDMQISRIGDAYRQRRHAMETAIRSTGLKPAKSVVSGGSSFWMEAPAHIDTRKLADDLSPEGVLIEPGYVFFKNQDMPSNFYRLAYSSIETPLIGPGIDIIAKAIENYVPAPDGSAAPSAGQVEPDGG